MKQPIHAIAGRREMTPERVVGIGFVVLLHIVAIWAIVTGLAPKLFHYTPPKDITLIIDRPQPPKVLPQQRPQPHQRVERSTLVDRHIVVTKPVEQIPVAPQDPQLFGDDRPLPPAIADSAALAIAGTHSLPEYPALARHMGWEGRVVLHLTISPQGIVTGADVVQSSGYGDLDQAAVVWVIQHWRYQPATHDGSPVESETNAAVVFNLRNAG